MQENPKILTFPKVEVKVYAVEPVNAQEIEKEDITEFSKPVIVEKDSEENDGERPEIPELAQAA